MARVKFLDHVVSSPTYPVMRAILSIGLCLLVAVSAGAQEQQKSGGDESWTKSKDNATENANPSRTTESHAKSGNRAIDSQKLEVLGPNGRYQPSAETETEVIQVDSATTRTTTRTYHWDANGRKVLAQVTEEEARTSGGGDVRTERKTSSADVNGSFQVVRREVADTKKVGPNAEETKSTVYQRDSYGGFSQTKQTQELKTHGADDSVALKQTTLMPDGNGGWKVSGVTEKTIQTDGQNKTTEESISSPDLDGRLHEKSRTVSKESETAGENKTTVETYDGGTQLSKRVTTVQKKDASGEITEQQVEQPNFGNPSDGMKVAGRTKYVVKYAGPGTEQTKTSETRDANGNYHVFTVETQKSTKSQPSPNTAPTATKSKAEAPAPQEKP